MMRGLATGAVFAALSLAIVALLLAAFRVPEPQRSSSMVLAMVVLIPICIVWLAIVTGRAKAASLVSLTIPGGGIEVLVLSVRLPDRKWTASRWRIPSTARLLIRNGGLTLTWADGSQSNWVWAGTRSVNGRRVWAAHLRAEAVTISAGDFRIEYVPSESGRLMRTVESAEYLEAVRSLVFNDDPRP